MVIKCIGLGGGLGIGWGGGLGIGWGGGLGIIGLSSICLSGGFI